MKNSLALALMLLSAPIAAAECPALRGLCSRLAIDGRDFLDNARGLLPNPARSARLDAAVREFPVDKNDPAPAARTLQLFERLRRAAAERAQRLAPGAASEAYRRQITALQLQFGGDDTRRYSGSTDGRVVTLDAWMANVEPAALVWVLGHELGHAADPCWQRIYIGFDARYFGASAAATAAMDPARAAACPADTDDAGIEGYADAVGAELVEAVLPELLLPASLDARRASLLQHALQPHCREGEDPWRMDAFISRPVLRAALACDTPVGP